MLKVKNYFQPGTIEEALSTMAQSQAPRVLAGGTDLMLGLKNENDPLDLVDIGALHQLRTIREDETRVVIGSLVTFSWLQSSEIIIKHYRALAEAAAAVGSPQIRNQGTIGGNVANASPAADTIPSLVAMEAEVLVASVRGQRRLKVADLLKGINRTALAPDELILEVSFMKIPGQRSGFAKLGRRNALAISRISVAVAIKVDEEKMIREARVALGAVAPNPFRSALVESTLIGKSLAGGMTGDIFDAASQEVAAKLGSRASAPYKREAVRGVMRQALERVFCAE